MVTKAFNNQRETDHHQETKAQNHNRWVFIDKIHQGFRCPKHDSDSDHDGNHHHR